MGITEELLQIIGSDHYMDSPLLSPREKAAVLWAEHVTRNTAKHRDDIAREVRKHFSETEFVELTFLISYFNMRNRYHDSLALPIDDEETLTEGTRGRRPGPEHLKAYLSELLDNWPDSFPEPNR